ncbi:hypothetical protein A2862_03535 [Candidatus Roizmanbacteria bacterium RIFCSPHIGHO2_01_FULL_38_41]|uniref:Uncharacterized protein n=1 Tax=Candidatus Roizmanbacteria bacterium RIFCSPHIGHO2_02_FULL_37_24 TaxID=1802037 RepID=A0A1F7GV06_9BACT|nr:MAG: hypothetical protein A2862_03535 [Candidatus Roizmanbacteria bacterium RIFCSPHIGHO2_01_FULL_38_41]OGK22869.1 MAG: hypothetical protein A3C24_05020 [Candidatus Roizmanbacteria bacterium RIFCSPHIGHO2_02_FULL_37_24]OGK45343.1 MAG: hypothetical protein A2956_03335 [Candidatus Roizmanbacteria bacterium RIFCSPLOWO2_01_FULL_37_57]OGK61828.1 MAG: hypothetical protein A3G65_04175 [Candidatus Roizmanbacteria bacterium RIFCSPLOWO2_12_FULL_37_7b]
MPRVQHGELAVARLRRLHRHEEVLARPILKGRVVELHDGDVTIHDFELHFRGWPRVAALTEVKGTLAGVLAGSVGRGRLRCDGVGDHESDDDEQGCQGGQNELRGAAGHGVGPFWPFPACLP